MSHLLIQRLSQVQNEFEVAKTSVEYVERGWPHLHMETSFQNLRLAEVQQTIGSLEATYIIRLFTVFESILRDFLPRRLSTPFDRRSAYDLINRTASKHHISSALQNEVHRVREFRNRIVHQDPTAPTTLLFTEALAALNRFLAWLPN